MIDRSVDFTDDSESPDFDAFNEASERIAEELDMEGHMKAFQERTEAFQEFLM